MILAIDIGNTHIVLGCIKNGAISSITRIVTNPKATDSEYAIKIRQILEFEGIDPSVLEAVYSACDSAENNKLEEWESDLIITRIVEKHSGARKLAHNTEQ